MSSPADQYAKFRRRQASPGLEAFTAGLDFELDDFQREACEALESGRGVLVAAPTGAGKTVVAEFGVHLALNQGMKCFYTTPIKALSNQKYADLCAEHGPDQVGLLTGDTVLNAGAPVVVMTTEVLRNMLYEDAPALSGLGVVVMDEVHYLADRFRGPVWEEVIIHLPEHVQVISLSATVSNAEELGAWLDTVRGTTDVVVSEHRPVPLWQHIMTPDGLVDLFVEDDAGRRRLNPDLAGLTRSVARRAPRGPGRRGHRGRGGPGRWPTDAPHGPDPRRTPSRAEVLRRLDAQGLLPAITFIFSRNGCDAAVSQCLAAGLRLTTPAERREIRDIATARCAQISQADLAALGYDSWLDGLGRGLAAHHAGMLPVFKEVVEELFSRGLVKAVFATETLALGINMPARTVVLEKLVKFNGEAHVPVTAGEYTQLTGRAGRRGIDVEGHAVVLWRPDLDLDVVAGLASTRTYPLRSSFRPTSNMAVNLVSQVGRDIARTVLESSFAQFQADQGVVGLARRARDLDTAIDGYTEAMACHLGDFTEYAALREELGRAEKARSKEAGAQRRAERAGSVRNLRIGEIVLIPGGRASGYGVVLDPGVGVDEPTLLTLDARVRRLRATDLSGPLTKVGRMPVPPRFNPRTADQRRDLASSLRNRLRDLDPAEPARTPAPAPKALDDTIDRLRAAMRGHPCHACPDREQHARWANRAHQARRERAGLTRSIEGRTNSIARTFDRICALLLDLGYLAEDDTRPGGLAVTRRGHRLRRIYHEKDLLVAQCLTTGAWDGLDPAGLAALAGAVVYESRGEPDPYPMLPGGRARAALDRTGDLWSELSQRQAAHGLDPVGQPDLGFVHALHGWARGQSLEQVLGEAELPAGDLVRWIRQAIDLLGQVAAACSGLPEPGREDADRELATRARAAIDRIDRAVVALAARA